MTRCLDYLAAAVPIDNDLFRWTARVRWLHRPIAGTEVPAPHQPGHTDRRHPPGGRPSFYDVNALSNFVTDAPRIVGSITFSRFVDHLEGRLAVLA